MTAGGNSLKNATAHKVNSYCTLATSYCTFCVGKHTLLGPASSFIFHGDNFNGEVHPTTVVLRQITFTDVC